MKIANFHSLPPLRRKWETLLFTCMPTDQYAHWMVATICSTYKSTEESLNDVLDLTCHIVHIVYSFELAQLKLTFRHRPEFAPVVRLFIMKS